MANRPAYVWSGSDWDTIADPGAVRNSLFSDARQLLSSTAAGTPAVIAIEDDQLILSSQVFG